MVESRQGLAPPIDPWVQDEGPARVGEDELDDLNYQEGDEIEEQKDDRGYRDDDGDGDGDDGDRDDGVIEEMDGMGLMKVMLWE